jgi:nucleoside-diphosphate-sugar epimerase
MDRCVHIEADHQRLRPAQSEVERLLADTSLARSLLRYEPLVELEDGLIRTIDWFREHVDRYRADVYNV